MMRAIIVDDEPLARKIIKEYLAAFPAVELVGECKDGHQAVRVINDEKPDLVFLDIRMPGIDGFAVLEQLQCSPRIIFTTAYGDFALRAFEVNAVDYLLKPFDRPRFAKAVNRALRDGAKAGTELERILTLLQHTNESSAYASRVYVRVGKKIHAVETGEIYYIEAKGDYACLHTATESFLSSLSLGELETRLDPSRFVRSHRSFILAQEAIGHLQSDGEGGYVATLKNKERVKVSRTHADQIRKKIW